MKEFGISVWRYLKFDLDTTGPGILVTEPSPLPLFSTTKTRPIHQAGRTYTQYKRHRDCGTALTRLEGDETVHDVTAATRIHVISKLGAHSILRMPAADNADVCVCWLTMETTLSKSELLCGLASRGKFSIV